MKNMTTANNIFLANRLLIKETDSLKRLKQGTGHGQVLTGPATRNRSPIKSENHE
jgi:hypothetical protein